MIGRQYPLKKQVSFCKSCRGMTLLEMLIALAISSLVIAGATQVLTQIFVLVPKAEHSMLAIRQVQFAGHGIERDSTMAQSITPTPGSFTLSAATPLVISYVDWDSENVTVAYTVDAAHTLQRLKTVTDKNGVVITSAQTLVADCITSITAQYAQPDPYNDRKILTLTITAQVGNSPVTKTYRISPRTF